MKVLLIVAAGKSSRFGGFPKAFCNLYGNRRNVDNTINRAKNYFDKIYLGVNLSTYEKYHDSVSGCSMFHIKTGQGDAHSILKCLNEIKKTNNGIDKIVVCWGDAVFLSDIPFVDMLNFTGNEKIAVGCSSDEKPYAWFDLDNNNCIVKSHFAREDGMISKGIHDQSIFLFDFNYAIDNLDKYRNYLNIEYDNDESTANINEMKLLKFFEYLYNVNHEPVKCVITSANNVLSFNTQEDLNKIQEKINSNQ